MRHVALSPIAGRHTARVSASAETWQAFRQLALARGVSVAGYLGTLVEAELRRREGRPLARITPGTPEPDQALIALADLRQAIDELDDVAGRLARSAVAHGASWSDVGSSLRLSPESARSAYRDRD